MLTRRLGRTGHHASVAILGGAAFARCESTDEAQPLFDAALAAGVNHLDIAPRYGNAERVLGPLVPAARDRLFVACKTTRHNADGVRAQLEASLAILGCDRFDLYQLHGVTDIDELDRRTAAIDVIVRARDEGLVGHVGITGHNVTTPLAQAEALRRWNLDTVMFPVYPRVWADPYYRRDAETLLALCADRDVGVMAIKAAAARPWSGGGRHSTTWYEPYTGAVELERGIRFALSTPGVHAFCTPGDLAVAADAIAIASRLDGGEPLLNDADRDEAMDAVANEPIIFPIPTA